MNGVEILNSYQFIKSDESLGIIISIIIMVFLVLVPIFAYYVAIHEISMKKFFLGAIFLLFCLMIFIEFFLEKTTYHITRYEVILSDEVNYNEFTEKYNVIEKRGKILVVEEK